MPAPPAAWNPAVIYIDSHSQGRSADVAAQYAPPRHGAVLPASPATAFYHSQASPSVRPSVGLLQQDHPCDESVEKEDGEDRQGFPLLLDHLLEEHHRRSGAPCKACSYQNEL